MCRRVREARSSPTPDLFFGSGLGAISYKLITFHRWNDELRYLRRFSIVLVALVAELVVENILVW